MLIQYTHYPLGTIVTDHKTQFSHTFPKQFQKIIIDYFKGLLITHHLDIFMSGKKMGLNGLITKWGLIVAN